MIRIGFWGFPILIIKAPTLGLGVYLGLKGKPRVGSNRRFVSSSRGQRSIHM